jgi:hypothetical protein
MMRGAALTEGTGGSSPWRDSSPWLCNATRDTRPMLSASLSICALTRRYLSSVKLAQAYKRLVVDGAPATAMERTSDSGSNDAVLAFETVRGVDVQRRLLRGRAGLRALGSRLAEECGAALLALCWR